MNSVFYTHARVKIRSLLQKKIWKKLVSFY